jgi:hypothetical protein
VGAFCGCGTCCAPHAVTANRVGMRSCNFLVQHISWLPD